MKNFNIDKYRKFLNRYKKIGYISNKSRKLLRDISLDDFDRIYSMVHDCCYFFNKQDILTLSDLLLYLGDDFGVRKKDIWYKIHIDTYQSLGGLDIQLPLELQNVKFFSKDDEITILNLVIMTVYDLCERNKKDQYTFRRMDDDITSTIRGIKPVISICLDNRERLSNIWQIRYSEFIEYLKTDIFQRYLDMIKLDYSFILVPEPYNCVFSIKFIKNE